MSQTSIIPLGTRQTTQEHNSPSILSVPDSDPDPDPGLVSNPDADSVPDGGYGWVIVASCSVLTFWFIGTTYSWGIIQAALVLEGVSDVATLSYVGGLTVTCIAVFAVVNAKIVRVLGARNTGMVGVGLLGLGEVLSGFTVGRLGGLVVTVGIIMGLGTSLCFMTVSIVPGQYFLRKRGLVNGLVYAGGGLGGSVISLALERLIEAYGTAWTFRIIGILTLVTGLPAAYLIKERAPAPRRQFVDWNLFRSLRFVVLFLTGTIATFPLFVPPFFLPLFAKSIGLSAGMGAGLVAAFSMASALGRIGCGFLADRLGPLNSLFLSMFLSAVSMLAIWPVSTSIGPLIVFIIINGVGNGGFFALVPTVVASVFGPSRVPVAMSMIVTGWVGGYLMGGPIAGYLLQAFGGEEEGIAAYRPAMYYSGSMSMAAAGLIVFAKIHVNGKLIAIG